MKKIIVVAVACILFGIGCTKTCSPDASVKVSDASSLSDGGLADGK